MPELSPHPLRSTRAIPTLFWIVAAMLAAYWLRLILLPFAVAAALAYAATPAIFRLQRRGMPRAAAASVVFIGYLLALMIVGFGIVRLAIPELTAVLADLPNILHHFLTTLFRGESAHMLGISLDAEAIARQATQWQEQSSGNALPDLSRLIECAGIGAAAVMGVILTIVLLLYFLFEGPRLGQGALWLVPPPHRPFAQRVANRAAPVLYRYIVGVILVVFYTIAATWLFTRLWLHLPRAELLAIMVGFLEMIPVLGPVLSVMIIALIAIEQVTFGMIVSVAIFVTALRLSIDQFVGPIVLGKATNLPPPLIIFVFLAGGTIYGVLGVLVAIPALAVGKVVLEELYRD